MSQIIPVYVINLDRRPDRRDRIAGHLAERGVTWQRVPGCDAADVPETEIARTIAAEGPLGRLGLGDRACTVSHTRAWTAFLATGAGHALFLEDDIYLAEDIAPTLAEDAWIPPGVHAVKLEKFNAGVSRLLLGAVVGRTPRGRELRPMRSRHVGGGAYILSREGAEKCLSFTGRMRIPVDHFLFNDTLSPVFRSLNPAITVPGMATQRHYAYESDIAPYGKAIRPKGWSKRVQTLRRGLAEVNQLPRQVFELASGRASLVDVAFSEAAPE
jgi:glycosyl transferase family 25